MTSNNIFRLSELQVKQPIINVGCIGHVSHGKSTLVKSLTNKKTPTHSVELERGITINIGFANLRIYYNNDTKNFKYSSGIINENGYELIKHISFVDCPGHAALMSTMISGTQVIKGALLLVAINDDIPQAQTKGHVDILKYTNIDKILILLNKIDLFKNDMEVNKKVEQLKDFIHQNKSLHEKPVVPISAFRGYNIEHILRFLSNINTNDLRALVTEPLKMCVLRSFNINPEGIKIDKLKGGIIGGSIQSGYIRIGEYIGIFPGYITKNSEDEWQLRPIFTKVISLYSENTPLDSGIAIPGGLIAVGLDCDPALCKQNHLLGNQIIKLTKDSIREYVDTDYYSNILIVNIEFIKDDINVDTIKTIVMIINSKSIKGSLKKKKNEYKIQLEIPIFIDITETYPILFTNNNVLEIFGLAKIERTKPVAEVILPSKFEEFCEQLPESYEEITIIDDLNEVNFDTSLFELNKLEDNLIPDLDKFKVTTNGIILPELVIEYDIDKILWVNFEQYNTVLKNLAETSQIDITDIRTISLDKIILPYLTYVYGLKECNDVTYLNGIVTINIKTKKIRQKLEIILKSFFKEFNLCNKCKKISCLVVKIHSKVQKICYYCSSRTIINDSWVKMISI